MDQKDLVINHYKFTEMLCLYTFPFDYTDYHILEGRKKIVRLREEDVDEEIVEFYKKVLLIIECVYLFRNNQKQIDQQYLPKSKEDNIIVEQILAITNYGNLINLDEFWSSWSHFGGLEAPWSTKKQPKDTKRASTSSLEPSRVASGGRTVRMDPHFGVTKK